MSERETTFQSGPLMLPRFFPQKEFLSCGFLFMVALGVCHNSYAQMSVTQTNELITPFLNKKKLGVKGCVKSMNQEWIFEANRKYQTKYQFNRYGDINEALNADQSYVIHNYSGELLGYDSFAGENFRLTKLFTEASVEKKDKQNRPILLISQTRERDVVLAKAAGTKVMQFTYKGGQNVERKMLEKRGGAETYRIWTDIFLKNDLDEKEANNIAGIKLSGDPDIQANLGMSVYGPSGLIVEKNGVSTKIFVYEDGLLKKLTILLNDNSKINLAYKGYKFDAGGNWLSRDVESDGGTDEKLTKETREIEYYSFCD